MTEHRYMTVDLGDEMSIELPDGIGVVHIRTGGEQPRTGHPMISVEVVSDSIDTPADDGRFYQAEYSSAHETIYLVGHPDSVQEG